MKKLRLIIVAATLMAVAFSASAQTKVGSVNMKKLFDGYYKTKMAQTALDKQKTDLRKELKDMADALKKAKADYQKLLDQANDQALSADERQRRQKAATDKASDISSQQTALEQYQRQAEAQLSDQSQRMVSNLVKEIQQYVAATAKADGYSIVINSANNDAVVYTSPNNDITAAVLARENAGAPIDVTTTPASPSASLLDISTNMP